MDSHDDSIGGQWLTYAEIAKARGIKRLAAVRLVQRHRWRRQRGNDGFARVLVPDDMLRRDRGDSDSDMADDIADDSDRDTPALLAAIEAAHRGEVEALKGEVAALKTLTDSTSARLVDTERRLAEAEERESRARAEAQVAHEATEALRREDAARKARGRLRRAWDGWRGR
jgi:hypothetical protein